MQPASSVGRRTRRDDGDIGRKHGKEGDGQDEQVPRQRVQQAAAGLWQGTENKQAWQDQCGKFPTSL